STGFWLVQYTEGQTSRQISCRKRKSQVPQEWNPRHPHRGSKSSATPNHQLDEEAFSSEVRVPRFSPMGRVRSRNYANSFGKSRGRNRRNDNFTLLSLRR